MKLQFKKVVRSIAMSLVCFIIVSCTSTPRHGGPIIVQPGDAIPKKEAYTKGANPNSYVVRGKKYHVKKTHTGYKEQGTASWYGKQFHGKKTANAEKYDMYKMTAAHKSLPIPSYVKVTNLENHKTIIVRVNDRGPFHSNRIIDLSYAAAQKLGMHQKGTAKVEVEAITVGGKAITLADSTAAKPEAKKVSAKHVTKKATAKKPAGKKQPVKKSSSKKKVSSSKKSGSSKSQKKVAIRTASKS